MPRREAVQMNTIRKILALAHFPPVACCHGISSFTFGFCGARTGGFGSRSGGECGGKLVRHSSVPVLTVRPEQIQGSVLVEKELEE